ncbi:MAG: PD-(D/E)XK nuclease family transposase, partial [Oscillospiraceae bacterium]|nr:PD-(D/E)XK nuclease family transposase [Oscillospiraceae bacterium]
MKIKPKTKEQQHEENLKTLQAFRPLDDDFMRELFRNNLPLAQMILRIITGIDDLVIIRQETQYDLKRLVGARSICLDVICVDSKGRFFNIEIQKEDEGADPYRARYHLSSIDVENLRKNQKFKELPDTYVIFITEKDIFGEGEPIYKVERVVTTTNKP